MSEKVNEGQSTEVETQKVDVKEGQSPKVETQAEEVKTYSEEEVQKIIQSERDKVINKKTRELKEKEAVAQTLEEKVASLEHYKYSNMKKEVLEEAGAPTKLSKFIQGDTEEEMKSSLQEIMSIFDERVNSEIEKRLQGSVRKDVKQEIPATSSISEKEFKKMTYIEKVELKANNPELYKKLTKR